MSILNLKYFLGLGVGMLIGYRPGFLARPYGYSNGHTYQKEHKGQNYNKREDGLIECATSKTKNYIKVTENVNVKINYIYLINLKLFFTKLKKFSDYQDVESEENSKVCNLDQDICYGTLTISNVNITVSDGKSLKEVVDLMEIIVEKGCASSNDLNNKTLGKYNKTRRCWTSQLFEEDYKLSNKGYVFQFTI